MGGNKQTTNTAGSTLALKRYNQLYGGTPNRYDRLFGNQTDRPGATQQDPAEADATNMQRDFYNRYTQAADRQTADYGNIMSGYRNLQVPDATNFSFERVRADRPAELGEAYGYLREAMPGYRNFAETGGYSAQDIEDLRARGISPIRAAYANANREVDRAKSIGSGYAPNYIAAKAKMTRDQSQGVSDATQNVNARLAEDIRTGKLAGLAGITNVGGTMGGLSSQEAQRMLTAALANQGADIQTQGMSEASRQNRFGNQMSQLGGQANLYGTTPGMASTFGNQALQSMSQRLTARGMNQDNAARLLQIASGNQTQQESTPWWRTALAMAGTAAPYVAMAFSDKNMKEDIDNIDETRVKKGIKKLNFSTWRYKGDPVKHMGPMAQDVKKHLGIGDGKTIHLADIMGVMLMTAKENASA